MRIIMNVKEQKEQWKTFVKITARLDISPEDSIAETQELKYLKELKHHY